MFNAQPESRRGAALIENVWSEQILDAAIEVHRVLGGPGLLETYSPPLRLCVSAFKIS